MSYKYLNVNPLSLTEQDCVTRAISLATGYSYPEVQDKLYYISELLECERLCVCCYRHLLDDIFKFPRQECTGMTVGEFAMQNPDGVFLIRMNGHLSCIVNGTVYDIWDCRNEILTDCWYVDKRKDS
jgi:hypothetical protein